MGLGETQAALARLLTEAELRERFFAEPEATGARLRLSAGETRRLLQITAPKASEMACALQIKRRVEINKILPGSAAALGDHFAPLFRRFSAGFMPQGVRKHAEDALAFAEFLRQNEEWRTAPIWQRDLLRYESAWLQLDGRHFLFRLFTHDARRMASSRIESQQLGFSPTGVVWFRCSQNTGWRVLYLRLSGLRSSNQSLKS